jgi:hypothetical protein
MSGTFEAELNRMLFAMVAVVVDGPEGRALGTSFLFTSHHGDLTVPVLVANRSLVERADRGRLYFTRGEDGRPVFGEHLAIEMDDFSSWWHAHPDPAIDLAVAPFGPIPPQLEKAGRFAHVSSLDQTLIPALDDADVDVVEDVLVPGFVGGLQDRVHLLPLTQRGVTASPFQLDYDGQSAFVIQLSIYPGLGGSPVLAIRRVDLTGSGVTKRTTQIRLLGVVSRVAERKVGQFAFVPIPPAPPTSGSVWVPFALAIRADKIPEAVDDLLRTLHSNNSAEARENQAPPSVPSAQS